jgi:PAS domain S-box-containing protein
VLPAAVAIPVVAAFLEVASAQSPVRTVLTVHWSAEDFPSTPLVDAAIRRTVMSGAGGKVDYFTEYLESDRFPSEEATQAFTDYIRRKYAGRPIDVVVAISDPALEYVLGQRSVLFPDVPVVASIALESDAPVRHAGAGLTGIFSSVTYDKTLELALRLHPKTSRVFVVAHAPTVRLADKVRTELEALSHRVAITYLEDASVERLLESVRTVPRGSLILYVRHSREEQGNVQFPSDIARLVSEAAPVPVYGVSESYIGSGVVGGVVTSREQLGTSIGQITNRILSGTRAQDIPMEPVALVPTFDWRQVKRWGIDPAILPAGSDVQFRQPTVWELYRGYIVGAMTLILMQSVLIGALLFQRAQLRRAEAALRESEAHFRIMADTAPVMIWRSGVDKKFDFFNLTWLRFTGRTLAQELGDAWAENIHPEDLEPCLATYRTAFDDRVPFRMEYRLRRFDGEYRWMLDTGEPRWESPGVFAGYIGSCLDLTDRKQAELALQETHAELSRVSRLTALGEFAASVAHEVRQPLTAIIMNARSCLRGIAGGSPDLADLRAGLLDVVESGQRAEEVIQRNRELFRHHTIQATTLDINGVIREAVALAAARLRDSEVSVALKLAAELPAVMGDRIELQQVLLNLIANAIDAMDRVEPVSRVIEIASSRATDALVKVSVSDRGVGLDGVDTARMFTISYTTKAAGTGVGLSISRSIVEAHGGRLWAEPNATEGATFSFTVPVRQAASAVPMSAAV